MGENVVTREALRDRLIRDLGHRCDELLHVARVLHEDIGQVLTVAGLHLEVMRQDVSKHAPEATQQVTDVQHLLEKAVNDVRELSYRLNPSLVPRSGLRYALDSMVGRLREESGTTIRFLMDSKVHPPLPVSMILYEIAEESLRNAVQHSRGNLFELVVQPRLDSIILTVKDNGIGFHPRPAAEEGGFGLLWMLHRAEKAGIAVQIVSSPGNGTTVEAVYRDGSQTEEALRR
ncbi:MAG: histidine kinase [Bryobacteraceae bacterium]